MALGNTQINSVNSETELIYNNVHGPLKDSWNTFQYVAKNLRAWADETTIGTDAVNQLIALTDKYENLINNTSNLLKIINSFLDNQRNLNN